jgi:ABC-type multidrug transport system fused ATPase/permease subunit
MEIFKKYLSLLAPNEKRKALLLLIMILIMAILDMIGVASILPFMAVLTNPGLIETNFFLNSLFQYSNVFGVDNKQEFLFSLGAVAFLMLIFSLIFKALTTYVQLKYVQMIQYSIGKRLVEKYLQQPYSWFLDQNSSELGKNILSEVQSVVSNGISPLMDLIAKSMIVIALLSLLILVDPKLAIIVGLSLFLSYLIIFYFVRNLLHELGKKRLKNQQIRFKLISEVFGASKEVKLGGLENIYLKNFSDSTKIYSNSIATSQIIAQIPRFVLEVIAFGGILLVILYFMLKTGNINNAIPIVSLYVFAGYRLMPALQQIYTSFTQLTYILPSINKMHNNFNNIKNFEFNLSNEPLSFNKSINLRNITYNYPNKYTKALDNINMTIPVNSTIGLVGTTGSGKTTTVDIILGLLEPQQGFLEVDGHKITNHNLRSWQNLIGYVPQNIYLSDDTVEANIAFGVDPENINHDRIIKVSEIANLHKFIKDELPNQYLTEIGERGVKLSGGQRQRIGIARALYHNPKLIIFDEATSSLDFKTEEIVMSAVNKLQKEVTIILIAHRLNTLKNCDIIFKIENGKVIGKGKFEELIKDYNNF